MDQYEIQLNFPIPLCKILSAKLDELVGGVVEISLLVIHSSNFIDQSYDILVKLTERMLAAEWGAGSEAPLKPGPCRRATL